jgi:hypothetical protein
MKKSGISSVKSNASFVKKILRKFVKSRPAEAQKVHKKLVTDYFSANYERINHCSVHVPVDGRLEIFFDPKHPLRRVSVPVQSAFLVTCTKEGIGDYRLTWAASLS